LFYLADREFFYGIIEQGIRFLNLFLFFLARKLEQLVFPPARELWGVMTRPDWLRRLAQTNLPDPQHLFSFLGDYKAI